MLIITGLHRSGTTFLGKILEASNHFHTIHEPLNLDYGIKGVDCWYPYFSNNIFGERPHIGDTLANLYDLKLSFKPPNTKDTDSFKEYIFRKLIKSRGNIDYLKYKYSFNKKEILLKDPFLSLCSNYLINNYTDVKSIYVIRHPVAIYQSLQRMNWGFDFKNLLEQPSLFNDYLKNRDLNGLDLIDTVIELWNLVYQVIFDQTRSMSSHKFFILKHEDLSMNPNIELENICNFLGIPFNTEMQEFVNINMFGKVVRPKHKNQHDFNRNSKALAYSWENNFKSEYRRIIEGTASVRKLFNYENQVK